MLERSSISHIRHIQIYCRAYVRIYQLKIKSGEELLNFMGMLFTVPIQCSKPVVNGSLSKASNTLGYISIQA